MIKNTLVNKADLTLLNLWVMCQKSKESKLIPLHRMDIPKYY